MVLLKLLKWTIKKHQHGWLKTQLVVLAQALWGTGLELSVSGWTLYTMRKRICYLNIKTWKHFLEDTKNKSMNMKMGTIWIWSFQTIYSVLVYLYTTCYIIMIFPFLCPIYVKAVNRNTC